jgi:hypothetical protein
VSTIKLRGLSKYGIVTDLDPYDLPPEAFSNGVNARFRNGRVTRGPVFRSARTLIRDDPRFAFSNYSSSNVDQLFIGYQSGRVYLTTPTSETSYVVSSFVDNPAEGTWTYTHLADVIYVNRDDRVPWSLSTSDTRFQPLAGWDSTWRTKLLRSCGGALVALNVTKAGITYPQMVKTSSFALSGSVPASWDQTDPATNATENILAELEGPILDAQGFGSNLIIYGRNQAWLMQKVAGFELFDYTRLPFAKGAISNNCVIEIDGKHFVFGPDDIWVHDGTSEASICAGQVRDFIFGTMDATKINNCFVTYNAALQEIYFCYPSGDGLVSFLTGGGCNKQAVYNLKDKTWTFDDLPNVYGSARVNLDSTVTYETVTQTYVTIGGTYQDQDGSLKRTQVYVGVPNADYGLNSSLYAFDPYGAGSTVAFAVDANATKPMYLERDGIDLHAIDPDLNLEGYMLLSSIIPLGRLDASAAAPITFSIGSSDNYGDAASFDVPPMDYDSRGLLKLDYNATGRYLSMQVRFPDYAFASLSGYDFLVEVTGER